MDCSTKETQQAEERERVSGQAEDTRQSESTPGYNKQQQK
jgi:hypothetical protein